jgi:DNA-binding transcriptional regulator YiaG
VRGAEVRRIRRRLGLTQERFARLLGVHRVTLARWETEAAGVAPPIAKLLRILGKGKTR